MATVAQKIGSRRQHLPHFDETWAHVLEGACQAFTRATGCAAAGDQFGEQHHTGGQFEFFQNEQRIVPRQSACDGQKPQNMTKGFHGRSRSGAPSAVNAGDTAGQVFVSHHIHTGIFNHGLEGVLVWEATNGFGQILI